MLPYSAKVLEHFQAPRHVGRLEPFHGIGRLGDPDCGDFLELTLRLSEDHQRVADVAFRIKGCPAAIATSSMTADLAVGRTVEEAAALTDRMVIDALDGLPPGKEHCSVLAVKGLHLALQNALFRLLFKRAGIVDNDADFDQFFHACDGSCEGPGPASCGVPPVSSDPSFAATLAPVGTEQISSSIPASDQPVPGPTTKGDSSC